MKIAKKMRKDVRNEMVAGILFASPWLIGFLVFTLYPILASFFYSFTDYNGIRITRVGLFNYIQCFKDVLVVSGFKNTLYYVIFNVPISTVLGIAYGMLLTRKVVGQRFYRTIFYLPNVISIVAISFLWKYMFDESYGPINQALGLVGLQGPGWLTDENWVKPSMLIISAWGVGGTITLYLSAIENVPQEQLEAAKLDGANAWKTFSSIILPNISPIISFNVLLGLIGAFQYYLNAYIMTSGGPNRASYFLGQVIYENAFRQGQFGYASAVAYLLMVIVFCMTLIYLKLSKKLVFYN